VSVRTAFLTPDFVLGGAVGPDAADADVDADAAAAAATEGASLAILLLGLRFGPGIVYIIIIEKLN
tara:strand:+ start:44 stop:241 length:198 start_codon:yes stop_codon:yes gene_type:complete